jgi:hypothetical protein
LKNYSIITFLAAAVLLVAYQTATRAAGDPEPLYRVEPGRVIIYTGESAAVVPVAGAIGLHQCADGGIYYIKCGEEGALFIGFIDARMIESRYEKKLPEIPNGSVIKKMRVAGGVAYLLAAQQPPAAGTLYRININAMETAVVPDVADFELTGTDLFLLKRAGTGAVISLNGTSVPVTLGADGSLSIQQVTDGRLVFVTNGEETEIIDLRAGMNLYRYSGTLECQLPGVYNLSIQAADERGGDPDDREMIFYKIFIDGVEAGRTDAGPASLSREFKSFLEANRYHLVKLERWALNGAKSRYERVNNINQPKPRDIFIPLKRIVKLVIRYNGKQFNFEVQPVYR